jgi:5-methylcytosine-specific restriction endonuclease McrA
MSTSLIRMLSRIANSGDPGEVARAELERQTKAKREKSRRLAPRRKPGREAKGAKASTRRDRMAEIAEAVRDRADGRCEICHKEAILHVHHIVSGSGKRRAHESKFSCIGLCAKCHLAAHRSDMDTLAAIQFWADCQSARSPTLCHPRSDP